MADRLFVSYSRKNERFALSLAQKLRDAGIANWIDQLDIPAGADWKLAIEQALEAARGVVAILSRPAVESPIVQHEIAFALERGRPVYPILIEDCHVPQNLKSVHYIDFRRSGALDRVLRDLRQDSSLIGDALRKGHSRIRMRGSQWTLAAAMTDGVAADMRATGCTPVRGVAGDTQIRWLEPGVRPAANERVVNGAIEALSVGPQALSPVCYFEAGGGRTDWFKDAEFSPEMVVVPAGHFTMGAGDDDGWWNTSAVPRRTVVVDRAFAMGRFAVTVDEYHKFVTDSGRNISGGASVCCSFEPQHWKDDANATYLKPGYPQTATHPVTCVSWDDAVAFTDWLESKTNRPYRLPTEAEWEYSCRAGTRSVYWFGSQASGKVANYCSLADAPDRDAYRKGTVPADAFTPNAWGLYNVHGNCAEMVTDGFRENYFGAPLTTMTVGGIDEYDRVVRGGSWAELSFEMTSAARKYVCQDKRYSYVGFRVARDLA